MATKKKNELLEAAAATVATPEEQEMLNKTPSQFDWGNLVSPLQAFDKKLEQGEEDAKNRRKIPGAPESAAQFVRNSLGIGDKVHCKRFITGHQIVGADDQGHPDYAFQDDSEELGALLTKQYLTDEILILKRVDSMLKDGTMVVWLEWVNRSPEGKND